MTAPATLVSGTYDYRLVLLSILIAVITSFAALDLAGRVTANRGVQRLAWLLGGAIAMGSGIWCMHYTGMLAFDLPIPVLYHLPTVAYSLIAAIAASAVALYVVSRERLQTTHLIAGSILMGGGVATMHYTGMAAMRMKAMHHYNPKLWVLSIVVAIVLSLVGLFIIFKTREQKVGWRRKLPASLVLGLAIPAMHYTGMAGVTFMPMDTAPNLTHSVDVSALAYVAILAVTILILGFTFLTSLVDRRLSAQQSLLVGEREMLRALIDNIPDFMYVKDRESRFILANPAVTTSMGSAAMEGVVGKSDFDFFAFETASAFYEDEQQVMRTGEALFNHEEFALDSEGKPIPILTTKVPLRDAGGNITGIAGISRNISQLKENEEALREAERKYRGMFDDALFAIFQVAPDGQLQHVNAVMAKLMGYESPADMLSNMTDSLWSGAVSPERLGEFGDAMKSHGYVKAFELEIFRKDRTTVWISTTIRSLRKDEVLTGYEGMCEDITERKVLREQLLSAQKLESVGQLAAGIAHEINTPVQYIGDNVRFLKDTFQDMTGLFGVYRDLLGEARANTLTPATIDRAFAADKKANVDYLLQEIPGAIDQTLDGIQRVATLVSAMKEFSHPGTVDKVPLDVNHAVQSTISVARNEWKYVANMKTSLDPALPFISCQPGQINQVILNLIVNAAHAIAERHGDSGVMGTINVQTKSSPAGIEIRIGDTGLGIPLHVRTRIFDPFFTTKEIGKGTGQGLAIARSVIVDKHDGTLHFETIEGEGTTFIVRLPHDQTSVVPRAVIQ
jgi:PAS domain S-box-containing protein